MIILNKFYKNPEIISNVITKSTREIKKANLIDIE